MYVLFIVCVLENCLKRDLKYPTKMSLEWRKSDLLGRKG